MTASAWGSSSTAGMTWCSKPELKFPAYIMLGQVSWEKANETWSMGVGSNETGMVAVRGRCLWFVLQHDVFTIKQQKWLGPQVRMSKMSADLLNFLHLYSQQASIWLYNSMEKVKIRRSVKSRKASLI